MIFHNENDDFRGDLPDVWRCMDATYSIWQVCVPEVLFQPIYRLGQPNNHLLIVIKNGIERIKYPQSIQYDFET